VKIGLLQVTLDGIGPYYLQIADQVEQQIRDKKLPHGYVMPAVYQLAEELVLNPHTVARAYQELNHRLLLVGGEVRSGEDESSG
jgi:DNA-binding transcriptional regulator YhcF (GntR family)